MRMTLASTTLLLTLSLVLPIPAGANDHVCNGKEPTVEGNEGTDGDDVIIAERYDIVRGYGGDDTICAWVSSEDDVTGANVYGGAGNDWIEVEADEWWNWFIVRGGPGHDRLAASAWPSAHLIGGSGNDRVVGSTFVVDPTVAVFDDVGKVKVNFRTGRVQTQSGTDTIVHIENVLGGDEADVVKGTKGRQLVNGGRGNDRLNGGPGFDELDGGPGDDTVHGARGRDRLFGGVGHDDIYGDRGVDFLWLSRGLGDNQSPFPFSDHFYTDFFPEEELMSGILVNLAKNKAKFADTRYGVWGIERVLAFRGDDNIIGDARRNKLFGDRGDDRLHGRGGNDDLIDKQGTNYFNGGGGYDLCERVDPGDSTKKCEQKR